MVRMLKEVLDALPPKRRAEIDRRFDEVINEVESLKELRRILEVSQARMAETLKISQPAVSKIEKQTDMYLHIAQLCGGHGRRTRRHHPPAQPRPVKVRSLEDVSSS